MAFKDFFGGVIIFNSENVEDMEFLAKIRQKYTREIKRKFCLGLVDWVTLYKNL